MAEELVPVESYAAMKVDPAGFIEQVKENLGGRTLGPQDLDRVKTPSSGTQAWTVPSIFGEQMEQEITGVIVGFRNVRRYWKDSLDESGGGNPPDCRSEDAVWGYGDPGDSLRAQGKTCQECPNAQWGSGERNSQACQQRRLLFVLREKGLLPLVIDLAPSSVEASIRYVTGLLSEGEQPQSVISTIGLDKKSGDGVPDYSVATFKAVELLEGDVRERVAAYAAELKPVFTRVAQAAAEATDEDGAPDVVPEVPADDEGL